MVTLSVLVSTPDHGGGVVTGGVSVRVGGISVLRCI